MGQRAQGKPVRLRGRPCPPAAALHSLRLVAGTGLRLHAPAQPFRPALPAQRRPMQSSAPPTSWSSRSSPASLGSGGTRASAPAARAGSSLPSKSSRCAPLRRRRPRRRPRPRPARPSSRRRRRRAAGRACSRAATSRATARPMRGRQARQRLRRSQAQRISCATGWACCARGPPRPRLRRRKRSLAGPAPCPLAPASAPTASASAPTGAAAARLTAPLPTPR